MIRVLGIAGSLREGSYNRSLVEAAQELAPEGMEITRWERLGDVPLYNADVEREGDPEPVAALKQAIRDADALLIATPEYQHSVPGVLKNALDWASRPPGQSPLQGKPVAIMGASPGMIGTARAQVELREILVYNNVRLVLRPEVLVGRAQEKFDEQGWLTDPAAKKFLRQLLDNLAQEVRELQGSMEQADGLRARLP